MLKIMVNYVYFYSCYNQPGLLVLIILNTFRFKSLLSQFFLAFMDGMTRAFQTVNWHILKTISTTLVLSALLSACAGGGGSSDETTLEPTATFSIIDNHLIVNEDFVVDQLVATATNATELTVTQSTTGVVTVTASTSSVVISSILNVYGRTTLTITLRGGSLNTSTQVAVTVNAVNDTPTLAVSTTALTFTEDFPGTILVGTAQSDIEGDTLTLSVSTSSLVAVRVASSDSGLLISGIANANGQTTLTLTVNDGSNSASIHVSVTVIAVNDIPTLTIPTNNLIVTEDFSDFIIIATAVNLDVDTLTITVIESNTALVSLTTSNTDVRVSSNAHAYGRTTLDITVDDGFLSSTAQVVITVTAANDTPTLTIPTTNLTVTEDFSDFIIIATAVNVDVDTLTITVIESNMPLVSVTTSNTDVRVSSNAHAYGRTTLDITVDDGFLSSTAQVVITVTAANDTPTFTISTTPLTLIEDFATTQSIATASDVEGHTLTISVVESNTGVVTVTTSASGVFISSIADANGRTTLTMTVNDGALSASTQVTVAVIPANDTPTLSVSTSVLIRSEDFIAAVPIEITSADIDGDTLTISITESATGIVTVTTSATGILISSIAHANGRTTLTITVDDGTVSTSTQVAVTVTAVNDTPTFSILNNPFILFEDFISARTVVTAMDIDGDTLTLSVTESIQGIVMPTTSASDVRVSSILHASGSTTLTISVSDGELNASTQVVVTVNPVNDVPVLAVITNLLILNEDFSNFRTLAIATDVDDSVLSIDVAQSTTGVVTVTTSATSISVSSIANVFGQTTLTITVTDGRLNASAQVAVIVTSINDTPTLTVAVTALRLSEDFSTTVPISVTRNDIDGDTLTLSVSESTTGIITVITSDTGVFLSSIANVNGQTTLTITISDGRLDASAEVAVTVDAINDPPTFTVSTTALTLNEDFAPSIPITVTRSDVDSSTLTLSVTESTTGVVTATTSASGIQVSNILNANGQTTLTITVGDGRLNVSTQVAVTVNAVNDTPTISVSTTVLTRFEDFATSIPITVTNRDVDGDTLTFSVTESTTGVVTVTTTDAGVLVANILNANGQTTLTITVSDSKLFASTQVAVTVTAVNDTPTFTVSTTALTLNEDFTPSMPITVTSSDVDSNTLTLSVTESTTGVITVTTSDSGVLVSNILNANGQTTLTITISDGRLNASTQIAVIVNNVNDTPTFTISTTALTLSEDFGLTDPIIVTGTDIDGDPLTISVTQPTTNVVTATASTTGVTLSSIANANGQTTLTITVNDETSRISTQVTVTVNAVNDTPTLTVAVTALTLTEDFITTVPISVTRNDIDGDTLTLSVSESTTGIITVITSDTGVFLSSIADVNGQTTLTITVSDGRLNASAEVAVTLDAINDPPTFTVSTTDLTLNEDFAPSMPITVIRGDVDSSTLTLSVTESTTGVVTVTTTASGILVANILHANGQTTLTITVGDGRLNVSTQVAVTVNAINDPPTFTVSTTALTLNEDFTPNMPITVIRGDVDSSTLTLSVTESTTGVVTVTTTDAGVLVANILNANGQTTLTITVGDGRLNVSTQVAVTVNAINDPPTFTVSTTALTLNEDFAPSMPITVSSSDVDSNTLTLSVTESTTGVVNVTTTASGVLVANILHANGQTTLTITISDGRLNVSTQVAVTVNAINDPPTFTVSTTILTLNEDFAPSMPITVISRDVDSNTLTLSVTESTTGVVTVTTTASGILVANILHANGQTTLTITVSDGSLNVSTQVAVTVNAINDPPTFTVSTTALTLNEDFTPSMPITVIRGDVDSSTLTLSVTESTTGVVTVTTTDAGVLVANILNANGQTTLTITVGDGRLNVSTQVAVTVNAINDPPTFTVSTTALTLNEEFTPSIPITVSSSDVDSNTLTLSVTESTTGVITVTTTASGLQVANILNANGQTTLTITVSDGRLNVSTQVAVIVNNVNDTPTLTISTTALTLSEDFGLTIPIIVMGSDNDSDPLTISVTQPTTNVVTATVSTTGVAVSSIVNANGQTTLTITVNDETSSVSTQVSVTVTAVNDTPTLSVLANHVILNEDFTIANTVATASDVDENTLTLSVTESTTGVVIVSTSNTGVFVSSIGNVHGRTTLDITVSDGVLSASTQVTVTVNATNDPPILAILANTISLNEDFSDIRTVALATDTDGNPLTLTVVESTTGIVSVTTSVTGVFISSIANANGRTTLNITANDGSATAFSRVAVTVNAVNDTPTISVSTTTLTLIEDFATNVPISVTRRDIDSTALTLSVTQSTTGVVIATTSTSGILLSNILNANGQTILTISVSDGRLSASTQVAVTVNAVNDTPTISVSTTVLTRLEDFATTIPITVTNRDVDGDTLTFSVTESTTGVVNVTNATSSVQVSSIMHVNGQTTLTITVSDSRLSASTQVAVTVTAVNDPPTIDVSTTALTLTEDFATTVQIIVTGSDVDVGDILTISVTESTPGVVNAAASTSSVYLTSIDNANGLTTLTITINDGTVNVSTQVAVQITTSNDTPTLTVQANPLIRLEDFVGTSTVATAFDIDGDALTFSVTESTTGVVNVTISTSSVHVSSILHANGQTTLAITVNDRTSSFSTQMTVAVIAVNDTPTLSVLSSPLLLDEDFLSPISFASASDVDGDTLTFSVNESIPGVISATTSASGVNVSNIMNAHGQTTLTISVSDGLLTDSTQIAVIVNAENDTPTLSVTVNALTLTEDFVQAALIPVTRNDVDNSMLNFSAAVFPTGVVSVTTSVTGVRISSIENANGLTTLTITVSDSTLSASVDILLTVLAVNDPPTIIASTTAITFDEDFNFSQLLVTATDIDSDTLTYSATESTTGLVNVTTSTAGVQVSHVLNAHGRTTLTVTVSDGKLNDTTQVTVTVNPINDPPTLLVSTRTIRTNARFGIIIIDTTASDTEDGDLSFSVQQSKVGVVSVTTSAKAILLIAIPGVTGATTLTIRTVDRMNAVVTETVSIDVAVFQSTTPMLTISTNLIHVPEDFSTSVNIRTTSTDIDGDSIIFSVGSSTRLVEIATSTRTNGMSTITLSSIRHLNGTTTLTVRATDVGGQSVSENILVVVSAVNDTPTLTIPTATVILIEDFVGVQTVATAVNVDDDTVTLTVTPSTTGVVTIATSTTGVRLFRTTDANGVTTLTMTISDGLLSSTAQVVIRVTAVNDPPILTISTTALTLIEDFAETILIRTTRTDVEGDTITLSVSQSNTNIVHAVVTTDNVLVSRIENANGITTLTITASDGTSSSTAQVMVQVDAVNDPPTLTVATNSLTTIGSFAPITIGTTATDTEDGTLDFSVQLSAAGILTVSTASNAIVLNAINNVSGQTTLTVRAVDSSGAVTTQAIAVNVIINPSSAPTLAVSTSILRLQEDFDGPVTINATATDVDTGTLIFSVQSSLNLVNVLITTQASGISTTHLSMITLSPVENANGTTTLTIQTKDAGGLSITTEVVVAVISINDPPMFTVTSSVLNVFEDFSTLAIATAADVENDTITLSVSQSNANIVNISTASGQISITSIANVNGVTTLTITASDGTSISTAQVAVQVNAVNDPPTVTVSTERIAVIGTFTPITINATATDLEDGTLDFSVQLSAAGILTVSTASNVIVLNTINNVGGQTTLTVRAVDSSGGVTTQAIAINVIINPSSTPTLAVSTNIVRLQEDFNGPVTIQTTATDLDAGSLDFSVRASLNLVNIRITTQASGSSTTHLNVISLSPMNHVFGTTTLTIQTKDAGGLSATNEVVVAVMSVNDRPNLAITSSVISVIEDFSSLTFATVTDVEGDTITLSVSQSSANIVDISTASGQIRLIGIANANGVTTLTISASDGTSISTAQVVVNVIAVNDRPFLSVSTSAITLDEDFATTILIRTTRTDADGDSLTLTVNESSSSIVTLAVTTNNILVSKIANANGVTTLTLIASDGKLNSTAQVVIQVNAINDTPTLTVSTNSISTIGNFVPITIGTTATDTEDGTLDFSVQLSTTNVLTVSTAANAIVLNAINNVGGQTTLTVTAIDRAGDIVSQTIAVNVTINASSTPTLVISTNMLSLQEDFKGIISINATATDLDVGTLTYIVYSSLNLVNPLITTQASGSSTTHLAVITLSPIGHAHGTTTLTIQAKDAGNLSATTEVVVAIMSVNDRPMLTITSSVLNVFEDFSSFTLATVSDVEDDTITITVNQSSTNIVNISTASDQIKLVSIANVSGATTLNITISDGLLSTTAQVTISVTAVNDPPILTVTTTSLTLNEDFTETISIGITRTDVDSVTLTNTVNESNMGIVNFVVTTNNVIVSMIANANGATTLTLTASDGTSISTAQVAVQVNAVNDRPTVTVSTERIAVIGTFTPITINATATDTEDGTLDFSAQLSAAGILTVSTASNVIVLNTINNVGGQTTLTVRAVDSSGGVTTQAIAINVIITPSSTPTLAVSTNIVRLQEDFNGPVTIQTTATDLDAGSLEFSVRASLNLVNIRITTQVSGSSTTHLNVISLSPMNNVFGTTTLTIQTKDAGGLSATTEVVVAVMSVNDQPNLAITSSVISVIEDFSSLTFATVTDVEGDTITLSVSQSSANIVDISTASDQIRLIGIANANGVTTLTITASDGTSISTAQVVVNVIAVNDRPVLNVSTSAITLDEDFATTILIRTTRTDADGDTLTFTVNESSSSIVTLVETTNNILVSKIANANGITTLTLIASDGKLNSTAQVVIQVNAINDTPTLTVSTNSISTIGNFAPITIGTTATDTEDGTLDFSVQLSTASVLTVSTAANAIVLNAINNVGGQTTLTVTAIDRAGDIVSQIIVVNVIINPSSAPTLAVSTSILRLQEDFDGSVTINATATDLDTGTLSFSVKSSLNLVNVLITTQVSGISTTHLAVITLSAIGNANGTTTLTIQARDAGGLSAMIEKIVVIEPINDTPTLTIPTATVTLIEDFVGAQTVATAFNVDDDTVTLTVTPSTTGVVTIATSTTGVRLIRTPNANGVTTLTMTISDGLLSSTAQVVIRVTAVNDPPILSVSTTSLTLNEDFAETILIRTTRTDVEGDTITLSVSQSNTNIVNAVVTTDNVLVSRIENANGMTILTITASDGTSSSTAQVMVLVNTVNDPPTLTVSTDRIAVIGTFAPITIGTTATDTEDGTLDFSVQLSMAGILTVSTASNTIVLNTINNVSGQTTLTVRAVDSSGGVTTQAIAINVIINPSSTPTLAVSTNILRLQEDFDGPVTIYTTATDLDAGSLDFSVQASLNLVNVIITTQVSGSSTTHLNVISLSPMNHVFGTTTLTIQTKDAGGLSATTEVVVAVISVNDPPMFTVTSSVLNVFEDFSTLAIATAADVENDTITLSVSQSNANIVNISTTSDQISITSIANANGATTLTLTASDGTSISTAQVVVQVHAVNDPPTVTVSTERIAVIGTFTPITINATATDLEDGTLDFSVQLSATGILTVSTASNVIVLNTINNVGGQTTLTVRAVDSSGGVTTQAIAINVIINPSSTPTLAVSTSILRLQEDFDGPVTIHTTATDLDAGSLDFSVRASLNLVNIRITTQASGLSTTHLNVISLSPMNHVFGTTTLTIQTKDTGGLSATTEVVVAVMSVNDRPNLAITSSVISVIEDFSSLTFATVTDVEGDTITLSVSQSSTNIVDISTASDQIRLIGIANANGVTTLTITASDGTSISTAQVVVQVSSINDPPTLTVSTNRISTIGSFAPITIGTTATDIEDETLAYSVQLSRGGVLTVSTASNAIVLNAINNVGGQTTLTVRAVDSSGSVVTQTISVNVIIHQSATPTLAVSPSIIRLQEDFDGPVTINATALDMNPGTLTISVRASSLNVVNVQLTTQNISTIFLGVITLSPMLNANGTTTLTIQTRDAGGLSAQSEVLVTVMAVNDRPTLAVPSTNLSVFEDFSSFTIATVADVEDDTITFTVNHSSTNIVGISTTTLNQINLTSIADVSGVTTLTITASDGLLSTTTQVVVNVSPVYDPPALVHTSPLVILDEDFKGAIAIATATSVEVDTLTLTYTESNSGIVQIAITSDVIRVSSFLNVNGVTTLSITINDGLVVTTAQLVVQVNAVNDTPTLTILNPAIVLTEDFSVPTFIRTMASDIDNDTITLSVTQSTPHIVNTAVTTSGIRISSIPNANGTALLIIEASDSLLSSTAEAVVVVSAAVDTPTITISSAIITLDEDFSGTIAIATATSANSDPLTVTYTESSTGIVQVSIATGVVSISHLPNANGVTTLTITAQGGGRTSVPSQVVVHITPVNDPPTVSASLMQANLPFNFQPFTILTSATDLEDQDRSLNIAIALSTTGVVTLTTVSGGIQLTPGTNTRMIQMVTTTTLSTATFSTTLTLTVIDSSGALSILQIPVVVSRMSNTLLTITTAVKTIHLSWPAVPGASYYRLLTDLGRGGGFVDASTAGLVVSPNSANIMATTAQIDVSLHYYIPSVNDPQFLIQSCSDTGVCTSHVFGFLSNAAVIGLSGQIDISSNVVTIGNEYRLSDDGLTLAVGDSDEDGASTGINNISTGVSSNSGAVFVYTRNSSTDTWTQQAYIKASNARPIDTFGQAVALSADGNTLVVGASGEDSIGTGVNGNQTTLIPIPYRDISFFGNGAAYVFSRNAAGVWHQQAYIKPSYVESDMNTDNFTDRFGLAVALSADGNTLAVGVPDEGSLATGINGDQTNNSGGSVGAVYTFARNSSGVWTEQAYIKASNAGSGDQFGTHIALSNDGNTLAVGVPAEDSSATVINGDGTNNGATNSGAIYVFARNSSAVWTQQAYIKARHSTVESTFGVRMALSGQGNTLVSGLHHSSLDGTQMGPVYVFVRIGGAWVQQTRLIVTDGVSLLFPNFALNDDGNLLVVDTASSSRPKEIYVFTRNLVSGTWHHHGQLQSRSQGSRGIPALDLIGDGRTLRRNLELY